MLEQTTAQSKQQTTSLATICAGLFIGMLLTTILASASFFTFAKVFGNHTTNVAQAAQKVQHVQANLKIVLNQPGLQKDWPAYTPSMLKVPAYSLVTITIRNYDLGATPLPNGTPFNTVQGVVGGVAYADGHPYTALALEKIAHTFTIQQLNVNVPIPGDAVAGRSYVEVSFTFRTGAAGVYYFRCFDPCGTGKIGWQGPMLTKGYMLGTLMVQA